MRRNLEDKVKISGGVTLTNVEMQKMLCCLYQTLSGGISTIDPSVILLREGKGAYKTANEQQKIMWAPVRCR